MPRNHKPRRRYVPKRIDLDPIVTAISGAAALQSDQRRAFMAPLNAAFEAFRTGHGSAEHWCALADAMNVGETLTHMNMASDHTGTFTAAQAALANVHARHIERASWTMYPAEITAIDLAVWVHQIQLDHASQTEVRTAIANVQRRMSAALAGNASPHASVCTVGLLGRRS